MTDLLIPATAALLDGWTGPAVFRQINGPELWFGCIVWDGKPVDCEHVVLDLARVRLDLSRAEARDRVVRVRADSYAQAMGYRDFAELLDVWREPIDESGDRRPANFRKWKAFCDIVATLDPSDDTRLPDGSRWVDARALALCWAALGGAA